MPSSQLYIRVILTVGVGVFLTACGGGGSDTSPVVPTQVTPPTPVAQSPQSQAGPGFEVAFNQNTFNEPFEPESGDIIALDPTAEPIAVPDP